MRFIASLKTLDKASPELYGRRAMSLALLAEKGILIPPTVILKSSAAETFTAAHEGKTPAEAVAIKELQDELVEAYESLGVPEETGAQSLMSAAEDHDVLIISSPSMARPAEVIRCFGKKNFFEKALKFLSDHGMSAIIQKVINEDTSGQVIAGNEDTIIVRAYAGLQTFSEQEEFDIFHVSKGELAITNSQIGTQETKLIREEEGVERYPLKERAGKEKANEKEVTDMARMGKRCQGFLKEDIISYVGLKRQKTYVFFCECVSTFGAPAAAADIPVIIEDAHKEPPLEESIVFYPQREKPGVRPAEAMSVPIIYTRELDKPFAQQPDDNFILTIPQKELFIEEQADPGQILTNSVSAMKKFVLNADLAIRTVLEEKAKASGIAAKRSTISELVGILEAVPHAEDILRVESLKEKFLKDPDAFTLQDLSFSFETAKKFVRDAA